MLHIIVPVFILAGEKILALFYWMATEYWPYSLAGDKIQLYFSGRQTNPGLTADKRIMPVYQNFSSWWENTGPIFGADNKIQLYFIDWQHNTGPRVAGDNVQLYFSDCGQNTKLIFWLVTKNTELIF